MRRRVSTLLAAATAAMAGLALATGVAAAANQPVAHAAGFSVRPVEIDPANPLTRAYFVLSLARGSKLTRHVVVVNSGSSPVELLIYPVDGLTGATSGDVYGNRQDTRHGAGRWLVHATESIRVPAGGQFVAPFTVVVPKNAEPGDHLAGVAVEAALRTTTGGHFSVIEVFREVVGVEMIVRGKASPKIALRGANVAALPGTNYPAITVNLANTGTKLCKPMLTVALGGSGNAGPAVSQQLDTVLPGNAIPYPMQWPRALAAGTYTTTIVATHCGPRATLHTVVKLGTGLARTQVTAVTARAVVATASGGGGGPWAYIAIAVGGLGLGAFMSRRSHRRSAS